MPFYLRTGKRLPQRVTEIAIQFKRAPFMLFRDTPVERLTPNRLVLHIQPDEGISLRFGAKIPGPSCVWARWTWISATPTTSAARRQHRLRTPAVRLHDRRRDAVPARRHGRGRVERGDADAGRLEGAAAAEVPQLRRRHLGTEGGGRATRTGWATRWRRIDR